MKNKYFISIIYTIFVFIVVSMLRGFHPLPQFQSTIQIIPFYQFYDYYVQLKINMLQPSYVMKQLFENLILFMPLGIILGLFNQEIKKYNALLIFVLCSLSVEIFEIITRFGTFDVTDIIVNSLGAFIIFILIKSFKRKKEDQ